MAHIPLRMCIACREMYPQNDLIRFVKNIENGTVMLDTNKKLFGRGAYICRDEKCISLAVKKRGLERHFKCAVASQLYDEAKGLVI